MTLKNRHTPYLNDKVKKEKIKTICLRCGKEFTAKSKFNKRCDPCKNQDSTYYDWPGSLSSK